MITKARLRHPFFSPSLVSMVSHPPFFLRQLGQESPSQVMKKPKVDASGKPQQHQQPQHQNGQPKKDQQKQAQGGQQKPQKPQHQAQSQQAVSKGNTSDGHGNGGKQPAVKEGGKAAQKTGVTPHQHQTGKAKNGEVKRPVVQEEVDDEEEEEDEEDEDDEGSEEGEEDEQMDGGEDEDDDEDDDLEDDEDDDEETIEHFGGPDGEEAEEEDGEDEEEAAKPQDKKGKAAEPASQQKKTKEPVFGNIVQPVMSKVGNLDVDKSMAGFLSHSPTFSLFLSILSLVFTTITFTSSF